MTDSPAAAREVRAVPGKDDSRSALAPLAGVAYSVCERPGPEGAVGAIGAAPPGGVRVREEEVLVLDFGGQYSQLIARRIRECGVFSELLPHHVPIEEIKRRAPRGLILSG